MDVNPNIFFRQVTLALSSSLDINTALHRCYLYLRGVMPLDKMMLGFYDPEICALKGMAEITASGPRKYTAITPVPAAVGEFFWKTLHLSDHLISDTHLTPLTEAVAPYVKNQGCSEIILPLCAGEEKIGYLVLQARGTDLYCDEHLQLMSSVRELLSIAMGNTLRHMEVLELRDRLNSDNQQLQEELAQFYQKENQTVIGAEGGLRNVMEAVRQVAPLQNTLLILGETGVGKEVVASALHRLSSRREGPFVKVNCGAIPESLIDSELFGHEKGAFSGAVAQKKGRFERAQGGTIFLDEIGELPPAAQIRLLRVLQSREIERVGGGQNIKIDIRVIAATHRNLEKMVAAGEFREDLWFRINGFPIVIPPLRQRRDDIPELLYHLIAKKSAELGFRNPPPIAAGALETLSTYPWPGNVRELGNVVERALIQNKGRSLTLDAFSFSQHPNGPAGALDDSCGCVFPCLAKSQKKAPETSTSDLPPLTLDELTKGHIQKVLHATDGKIHGQGGAAELLAINPSTLRNRMNKLKIAYGKKELW